MSASAEDERVYRCLCCREFLSLHSFACHLKDSKHCLIHDTQTQEYFAPDDMVDVLNSLSLPCRPSSQARRQVGEFPATESADYLIPATKQEFLFCEDKKQDKKELSRPCQMYRCPSCSQVFLMLKDLEEHLLAHKHAQMTCATCSTVLWYFGVHSQKLHQRSFGHVGVRGVIRDDRNLIVAPDAQEFVLKPQYYCQECFNAAGLVEVTYASPRDALQHIVEAHPEALHQEDETLECSCGERLPIMEMLHHYELFPLHECPDNGRCPSLTRPFDTLDDFYLMNKCQRMYQCPECFTIASHWPRMLQHLINTTHTLPMCVDCNATFCPSSEGTEKHFQQTRHGRILGVFHLETHYEVVVDLTDPRIVQLIDEPKDSIPQELRQKSSARIVFQCPDPTCLEVFSTAEALDYHLQQKGHGIVVCTYPACGRKIRVWRGEVVRHEHSLDLPDHLRQRDRLQDYMVLCFEREIVDNAIPHFEPCPRCGMPLRDDDAAVENHLKSGECDLRRKKPLPFFFEHTAWTVPHIIRVPPPLQTTMFGKKIQVPK